MNSKTPTRARLALTPFVCIFALALAGCGGGGGGGGGDAAANNAGGGGGGGGATPASTLRGNVSPATVAAANARVVTAASATPNEGSVTQSSNVDGTNVTSDQVEATATYSGGVLRVSATNAAGGWSVDSGDIALRDNDLQGLTTGTDYRQRTVGKQLDDGVVIVDFFTDRLSASDTDYLVGGLWLYVPDTATALEDLSAGAFIDSPVAPTPAAYLQTTATANYSGDATGIYGQDDAGDQIIGEFLGDVTLTAEFSATPTISGFVDNLYDINDITRESITALEGNPRLNLDAADIADADGGFFTGDTSGTFEGATYSGKWGGQFYGSEAEYVGGTFGASTTNDDFDLTFVGVFGAEKE